MGNWDHPWMIGGGVEHGVEVARLVSHVAFSGAEGIVGAADLAVTAQASPNNTVNVAPGACGIINRSGAAKYEMYAARLPIADTVAISPTSGQARTDLIIARIEDPFTPGSQWPTPDNDDLQTTDYARTVVIPNVGVQWTLEGLGLNYSAIVLAAVQMPANTSTVLQSYITDLRTLRLAQTLPVKSVVTPTSADQVPPSSASTAAAKTAWYEFPDAMGIYVDIPKWANSLSLLAVLGQVGMGASGNNGGAGWTAIGNLRASVVLNGSTSAGPKDVSGFSLDADSGIDRSTLLVGVNNLYIPSSMRGKTAKLKFEAQRTSGNAPIIFDAKSIGGIDLAWSQQPQ